MDRWTEQREAELRGALLVQAHLAGNRAPDGWVAASRLALAARDEDRAGVDDDEQSHRLVDELIALGLLEEKRPTEPGVARGDLRHRVVRLSDKGRAWYFGQLDPIPGVWHWREGH
jgi:hypothetical protein